MWQGQTAARICALDSFVALMAGLIILLFCVTKFGWGFKHYLKEVNTGKGIRVSEKLKPYLLYVLPVLILFILIQGLL
ncbi:MAG: hypothetical protein K6G83_13330 [Lachnospiraceae bacterium]|nr:hypothetical protein [Lachnospiraceae bacterium]